MRPLTVITGILLGSCLAIMLGLAAVMVIFLVLGSDYPRLSDEFSGLLRGFLTFTAMTAICAASFYAMLTGHRARRLAQLFMWGGLLATGYYFWP